MGPASAAFNARLTSYVPRSPLITAGLEARGFLFGPLLAQALGVPFAPIRKQGKLPGAVLQSAYRKEYGSVRLAGHRSCAPKAV